MPVQTINYANMPLHGAEGITSGFNAVYGPIAAKRKAEADALASKLLELQIQYAPEKYQSETAYNQARADQLQQQIDIFKQFLSPDVTGEAAETMPNGQPAAKRPGGFTLDPSIFKELFRSSVGLGPESPEDAQQRAINTHAQNTINTKKIEQQFPTASVLTKNQEKIQGIEGLIPIIKKIIEMPVPSQAEVPLPGFLGENAKVSNQPILSQIWNFGSAGPNEQAKYEALASLAKDVGLKSQGLESNIANLKTIDKAISRRAGESEAAYKDRMRELVNDNINEYEHITGKKSDFERYDIENKKKGKSTSAKPAGDKKYVVINGKNYLAEDILQTMKDNDLTYSQVVKELEARNGR